MKKSYFAAAIILLLGMPLKSMAAGESYEAEGIYHGIAQNGLTGLGYTVIPYTVGTGLSASVNAISQPMPTGLTTIVMPSITLGLGKNIELSARTALVTAPGLTDTADTQVFAKYKFRSMGETIPAMAIVAGVTLPTATNPAVADVTSIGGTIMIVAGGEAQVGDDMVVGLYGNIAANFMDPGRASQNNYYTANLGMMIPISDDQKLQGLLEVHDARGKAGTTILQSGPQGTYRIGLRYAGRFLKITAGVEGNWSNAVVTGGVTFEI